MKSSTFGNTTVDKVLAEHLTQHPEMAKWSCKMINKTTSLIHELTNSHMSKRKFAASVFNMLSADILKQVNSPPEGIDEKAKTFTANIVQRHLRTYAKTYLND